MAASPGKGGFYVVCDCCDLEFPTRDALPWRERTRARRLKVLESEPHPAGGGPYREYWVEHEHRVCPACHANLIAGGRFRAIHRSRGKLALVVVLAAVALLIATLPITLPHMMSALWMLPGEGGR
ncbi:MAG TPA: hypothetical protein VGM25_06780 [Caulobacteraceae bacterium]|jgi:hypothetical protein